MGDAAIAVDSLSGKDVCPGALGAQVGHAKPNSGGGALNSAWGRSSPTSDPNSCYEGAPQGSEHVPLQGEDPLNRVLYLLGILL